MSGLRATRRHEAPSLARRVAMARPMPRLPPVMRADLPAREIMAGAGLGLGKISQPWVWGISLLNVMLPVSGRHVRRSPVSVLNALPGQKWLSAPVAWLSGVLPAKKNGLAPLHPCPPRFSRTSQAAMVRLQAYPGQRKKSEISEGCMNYNKTKHIS